MSSPSLRSRLFNVAKISSMRNFWFLWSATAASNLADGIFKLALPLLATSLTNSPALIAGVAFAVRLPWLLFALLAGVLADRFDRRVMMINANALRVLALLVMVLIMVNNMTLPVIYFIALLLGIAETLADTAASSILPAMVHRDELEKANARLVGITTLTNEFMGPPLGGALAAISFALAFATSSGLYLVAAIAIIFISGTYRPQRILGTEQRLLSEMASGLHYVWDNRLLRALVIIVAVMNVGWSAWMSIMVLYVVAPGPGGLSEVGYGVMLTSIGIGGLLGTVIAVPFVKRFGRKWAIATDILGTFVMLAIPALTANAWLIGTAAVIGGVGGAMWSIVVSSIRQQIIPDSMLGKSSGVFRLFGYGALPVGSALAGLIAELFGIPVVFALCAALTLLLLIPFFRDITPALNPAGQTQ